MSLLDYIATDPYVQIVFILAIGAASVVSLVFRNFRKAQKLEHDLRVLEPVSRNLPVVHDRY